jgi:hypothetical protein
MVPQEIYELLNKWRLIRKLMFLGFEIWNLNKKDKLAKNRYFEHRGL